MNLGIEGKCALVTGASRGLGRAVAERLAVEGARVAIVAREEVALTKVINEIDGQSKGHCGIALDLMEDGACEKLKKELDKNFGKIEIIVHNLGGTLGVRDVLSKAEDYQKVWQFNMGIAVELNGFFLSEMKENKWGRVVHISSSSAVNVDASLPYSSAKAALNAYVRGLGRELAQNNIIVTAVMPGPFKYEGSYWDNISKENPERYNKFITERMSVKRLGEPEDISGIVAFLCSKQSAFMPGAIVAADGGIK